MYFLSFPFSIQKYMQLKKKTWFGDAIWFFKNFMCCCFLVLLLVLKLFEIFPPYVYYIAHLILSVQFLFGSSPSIFYNIFSTAVWFLGNTSSTGKHVMPWSRNLAQTGGISKCIFWMKRSLSLKHWIWVWVPHLIHKKGPSGSDSVKRSL